MQRGLRSATVTHVRTLTFSVFHATRQALRVDHPASVPYNETCVLRFPSIFVLRHNRRGARDIRITKHQSLNMGYLNV